MAQTFDDPGVTQLASPALDQLGAPAFPELAAGGGPSPFSDAAAQGLPTSGTTSPSISLSDEAKRNTIVAQAMQYIGTPYVWGGTGPQGFDCSGLVQYVFGKNGVQLPRVSYQQANTGQRVGIKDLQVGDLVAWNDSSRNPGADHIAIYAGGGYIIEAPHTGADVRYRKLGSTGFDANAYGVHLTY